MSTQNPYSSTGSRVDTVEDRRHREDIKYGRDIRQALEAPDQGDWEDIQQFLGPSFCHGCEE